MESISITCALGVSSGISPRQQVEPPRGRSTPLPFRPLANPDARAEQVRSAPRESTNRLAGGKPAIEAVHCSNNPCFMPAHDLGPAAVRTTVVSRAWRRIYGRTQLGERAPHPIKLLRRESAECEPHDLHRKLPLEGDDSVIEQREIEHWRADEPVRTFRYEYHRIWPKCRRRTGFVRSRPEVRATHRHARDRVRVPRSTSTVAGQIDERRAHRDPGDGS